MKTKMFGHRVKKSRNSEMVPGQPKNNLDMAQGKEKDNPPGYEGKEHVKYKNPGFSKHHIRIPEDEPHMKSRVSKAESHEMEDNYHMDVPDQTEDTLPAKIKRSRMKMDAPNQEEPKPLRGNMVTTVPAKGVEDEDGEEEMGPNDMQEASKSNRKKMIAAVVKRKMRKG